MVIYVIIKFVSIVILFERDNVAPIITYNFNLWWRIFFLGKNYYHQSSAKMAKYLFLINFPAKYPMSETIYEYTFVLKLDFLKIKFQMHNSIFGTSSYNERGLKIFFLRTWVSRTRVPCKVLEFHLNFSKEFKFQIFFLIFFFFLVCYNSIVQKSSFKLKLNFLKIEF